MHSSDELPRALTQLIEGAGNKLTATETRVIQYLQDKPASVRLNGTELASAVGIHASTLVRLAKKLGFGGYPELRDYLVKFDKTAFYASSRHQYTLTQFEGCLAQATIDQEIEHLKLLKSALAQRDIKQATDWLSDASRVFILGLNNQEGFAGHFRRRLQRSGIDARLLEAEGNQIAEQLTFSKPGDVLFLFVCTRIPPVIKQLLRHARLLELKVIVISDVSAQQLPADVLLLRVFRGEKQGTKTVSPPLVLANILVRSLTRSSGQRVLDSLSRFEALRGQEV